MKYIILILCFLSSVQFSFGQLDEKQLKKYWNYRARFLGTSQLDIPPFVIIGNGSGESIPISGFDPVADCTYDFIIDVNNCPKSIGKGKVVWGDGTIMLGYYLAMLSTERALFKKQNIDAKHTERELYFALQAINRLDSMAEVVVGQPGKINGFFIRDDATNASLFNPAGKPRFFNYTTQKAYDCIQSDFVCNPEIRERGWMSQDQTTALLFGLAHVRRFADDARTPDGTTTLGSLAAQIAVRIGSHCSSNKWRLKTPQDRKIPNRWGGDLRAFAYGISKGIEQIAGNDYKRLTKRSGKVKPRGKAIYRTFKWAFGVQNKRNYSMLYETLVANGLWDADLVAKRSQQSDQIMYALAYSNLHNQKSERIDLKQVVDLIESAPWDGPCDGTPGCTAPEGWRSSDRWWHPNHKNGNPHGIKQIRNGIDFMLLYNHYLLYQNLSTQQYPKYKCHWPDEDLKY